jgi:DNA-binding transcriptional LysR family regulator
LAADLLLLRTFVAIRRTGSLSRAAKKLGLTQPAISQQLRALEEHVGHPLFARTARGVVATPAGEDLAALVASHIDVLEAVTERVRRGTDAGTAALHIGGPSDLLASRILPALARESTMDLRIVAHPGVSAELIERMRRGALHLAVVEEGFLDGFGRRGGEEVDPSLEHERLFEDQLLVVVSAARSRELRALRRESARRTSLADGPFIAFSAEMPLVRSVLETCFNVVVQRGPAVVVPDLRACAELVASSRAVGVLPRVLVQPLLDAGIVVELRGDRDGPRRSTWLITRKGSALSPRIAAAAKIVREQAPSWIVSPRSKAVAASSGAGARRAKDGHR